MDKHNYKEFGPQLSVYKRVRFEGNSRGYYWICWMLGDFSIFKWKCWEVKSKNESKIDKMFEIVIM